VGVDEARHDDHVGRVDGLDAGRAEVGADPLDAAVADEHIAARQRAERGIDGQDGAIPDQVGAARRRNACRLRPVRETNPNRSLRAPALSPAIRPLPSRPEDGRARA
jgi:hypothetical protein